MAAQFARKQAPKNTDIYCANDKRLEIHPLALQVMKEINLPIQPKMELSLDELKGQSFDVVVTLCNQAREICPIFPGSPARIHWPLSDPSKESEFSGVPPQEAFRKVRDDIAYRVASLFQHGFLEAILQSRLTFSSLLENLTDGVMAHDLDRRIYYFNQAAQKITGYPHQEVIGLDCHDVFPGRFCGGDCSFCEGGTETISRVRYPHTFTRKDKAKRNLEMSVVTVYTPQGEVTGALVIFRDMTEMIQVRQKLEESRGFHGIIGHHPLMQKVFDSIQELADVNVPILIQGESGTGKEMVATALHQLSKRSSGPFVPINCGALPEGTLESELFGHVKGAFTGAIRDKKGRFELAEGGTLFLDEIGEITPKMQVRLLRVIQEKSFIPVGGERNIHVDVRIICATNKDMKLLTRQGLFREDLYYRLAVVPITLPSLRERSSDIPLLTEHFIEKFTTDTGIQSKEITAEAIAVLTRYKWPGNVRELRNAVQYAMIKCSSKAIELRHLPSELIESAGMPARTGPGRPQKVYLELVITALKECDGNKAKAARRLGISRTSLYRYLARRNM